MKTQSKNTNQAPQTARDLLIQAQREALDGDLQKTVDRIDGALASLEQTAKSLAGEKAA